MPLPLVVGLSILFGAGVAFVFFVQRRRATFRVTCEVIRGQSLDEVFRNLPSESLDFVNLDDNFHPYAVVIISVPERPDRGTLQSEFRRIQGEPLIWNWPVAQPKKGVIRGLFQVPDDVNSVVTRVLDATMTSASQ